MRPSTVKIDFHSSDDIISLMMMHSQPISAAADSLNEDEPTTQETL